MKAEPKTLQEAIVYFSDPARCREYVVARRWPNGVCCPTCGSEAVAFSEKYNRWQCSSRHDRRQFTVKTGTIFEDSPLGLDKWLCAMWQVVNCKNGVSSYEIHRSIGVTQKSAWFMDHRIRLALTLGSFDKLSGEVEADETFIGGKARNMHKGKRAAKIHGRGKVVTSIQIRDAVGASVSEWARRLRELRDEEGWPIRSKNDDAKLKPNEYRLDEAPPQKHDVAFTRSISKKLRAEVLARNGYTCQHCGLGPDQIDLATGRMTRLHVGHVVDKSLGGKDELSNLRALCSTCNEGAKNLTAEKPSVTWLKGRIRSATQDDQRAILKWLGTKFGG